MDPIAREVLKRDAFQRRLHARAFDKQRALLNDRRKFKAIICARRAGKTMGGALGIIDTMECYPRSTSMVFGLTRETAKRIWWKDVLDPTLDALKLSYRINKSEASYSSPNGSICYFMGADASVKEMAKALGQKPKRVIADECGEYTIDLRTLVTRRLEPALTDNRGDLWLMGVPGDHIGSPEDPHFFYAVTEGVTPELKAEWSRHSWDTLDNPHMADKTRAALAAKLALYPNFKDTAEYIIEWTGRWFADPSKLIYHYTAARTSPLGNMVDIDAAPECDEWTYVLGVDFGATNATSFTLVAYRKHDPKLYVLRSYKLFGIDFEVVANNIRQIIAGKGRVTIVVDGAAAQGILEVKKRIALPLKPTDKPDKATFVRMLNTDLMVGRIKIVASQCIDLTTELSGLKRDVRAKVWKELDADPNDCADSFLYAWRYARNYLADPAAPPRPDPNSEEAMDQYWQREEHDAREAAEEDRRDRGGMLD